MGNINNKKDYDINEYGEIIRNDVSPKLDEIRGRITQPKPGNNPKKGNNYPAYILLILAILIIVSAVVIGFNNKDFSSVNTGDSISTRFLGVDSTSVEPLTPAVDTFKIFKTNLIKRKVEGEQSCIMAVSYPTGGDEKLVSTVCKWINKTLANITSISEYSSSLTDGNNLIDYYFNNIITGSSSGNWDICIFIEEETNEKITYKATYSLSYSDGEHVFEDVYRGVFRKSDGEIIN